MKNGRPESTAEALREVVGWFYTLDSIAQKLALQTGRDYSPDRQIQIDMSQLAEWFEAHPGYDREAWEAVAAYQPLKVRDLRGLFADDAAAPSVTDNDREQARVLLTYGLGEVAQEEIAQALTAAREEGRQQGRDEMAQEYVDGDLS